MTKDEALKMALEAFGEIEWSNNSQWQSDRAKVAITAIKEALAQPEHEPVGWAEHGVINWLADRQFNHTSFLYDTPAQGAWIELTDDEIESLDLSNYVQVVKIVQAKLKQKNT